MTEWSQKMRQTKKAGTPDQSNLCWYAWGGASTGASEQSFHLVNKFLKLQEKEDASMVLSGILNHKIWRVQNALSKVRASKAACYTKALLALPGGKVICWWQNFDNNHTNKNKQKEHTPMQRRQTQTAGTDVKDENTLHIEVCN
jgi:hypothetical protein